MNTITQALEYESAGFVDKALLIYKEILAAQPDNFKAAAHLRRLERSGVGVNRKRLEQFLSLSNKDDINDFTRWLIGL